MTTATAERTLTVTLRRPHPKQAAFVESTAPRIIIRGGRRGGKTVGVATRAVQRFLAGRRILYAAPTQEQVDAFWFEVKRALAEPIAAGVFKKNESLHIIELEGTKQRIRAKTAWSPDMLRGDTADDLILDEWQLMDEDTWGVVGVPMLLDNNGVAVFVYTPPSLASRSVSKARDPRHAAKMFAAAQKDTTGRWAWFHFTSHDNPNISEEALAEISRDMTAIAYRQEILAEDVENVPGALWTQALIDAGRVTAHPDLLRVVVGVDPPGGVTECGIITAGIGLCACRGTVQQHAFVLEDRSLRASPDVWADAVLTAYNRNKADRVLGEKNYGGDMVENTLRQASRARGQDMNYRDANATRGKAVRAEPCVAAYEQGRVHHVGALSSLEDEMVSWVPGETKRSPNRMDALVWTLTDLLRPGPTTPPAVHNLLSVPRQPGDNPLGLDMTQSRYQDKDRRRW